MTTEYTLPPKATPTNHGHTVASWILVLGVLAGSVITGIGMAMTANNITIVGLVVIVASAIASYVARLMGHGQVIDKRESADWYSEK